MNDRIPETSLGPVTRVLGYIQGKSETAGTAVFFAGVHGNETAGVKALRRLIERLSPTATRLRGRVVCLIGNLQALAAGRRYLAADLNRIWTPDRIEQLRDPSGVRFGEIPEVAEQRELLTELDRLFSTAPRPWYFFDLHTTSADSAPFIAINDQLVNRAFAQRFPIPIVLGLEEYLEGTLLNFLNQTGEVALAFETGPHQSPRSSELQESFVQLALTITGHLPEADRREIAACRARLADEAQPFRGFYEVIHRHGLIDEDQFRMLPGWSNFDRVRRGETIGSDAKGVVRSPMAGQLFMPLYQQIGSDGFFVVRPIPQWALKLSACLRRIKTERLLSYLPGVSRCPDEPGTLVVDLHIARFWVTQVFHLLGYRRKKSVSGTMRFSRREVDRSRQ